MAPAHGGIRVVPSEGSEKAKPPFIGEGGTSWCLALCQAVVVWSHTVPLLCLPGGQGPHHALQLSLEGTRMPQALPSPPLSPQAPGGPGQSQQSPQQGGCRQGTAQQRQDSQQEPLQRAAGSWGQRESPEGEGQEWAQQLGSALGGEVGSLLTFVPWHLLPLHWQGSHRLPVQGPLSWEP